MWFQLLLCLNYILLKILIAKSGNAPHFLFGDSKHIEELSPDVMILYPKYNLLLYFLFASSMVNNSLQRQETNYIIYSLLDHIFEGQLFEQLHWETSPFIRIKGIKKKKKESSAYSPCLGT